MTRSADPGNSAPASAGASPRPGADAADEAAYEAHAAARECPHHGATAVTDTHSAPSMLGHGHDDSETWACGCSVTWDPFTGAEHVRPA